jgi:membrane-bound lytic murein transglycosylase D
MHGVSVSDLLDANALNSKSRIYVGQILTIPSVPSITLVKAASPPSAAAPIRELPPKIALAPVTATPKESGGMKKEPKPKIQVPSETLTSLTEKSFESLGVVITSPALTSLPADVTGKQRKASPTSSELAKYLFSPAVIPKKPVPAFNEEIYDLNIVMEKGEKFGVIRVSVDETFSHFVDWSLIPFKTLLNFNGFSGKHNRISIGQKIRIPFSKRKVEEFQRIRLEYHMALEEDFYAGFRVKSEPKVKVQRGANIWQLLEGENSPPLWLVKKYNPEIKLENLMPDQEIIIPEIEAISNP